MQEGGLGSGGKRRRGKRRTQETQAKARRSPPELEGTLFRETGGPPKLRETHTLPPDQQRNPCKKFTLAQAKARGPLQEIGGNPYA